MTRMRGLVVTTINPPNAVLRALAAGATSHSIPFFVLGDAKSPPDFKLDGAEYLSLQKQDQLFPAFSRSLPRGHYVRKNLGYLLAAREGVEEIQETDDDNFPLEDFWRADFDAGADLLQTSSAWFNIYSLFSDQPVWPRGFPLEQIRAEPEFVLQSGTPTKGMIRQGLANGDPDVDAVYRLTRKLPLDFDVRPPVILAAGVWCPFNSQNTIFRREVFPLLYLPSFCSFRMTDIWRSFVAQRCLWELGEGVVFHSATMRQDRNAHNLLRDFEDEIPGYLMNEKIRGALEETHLDRGDTTRNVARCYEALAERKLIDSDERPLVAGWCREIEKCM